MKKELEVLVKIEEPEKSVWEKIKPNNQEKIVDKYFNFPDIVLRIRESNWDDYQLTYKQDVFRGKKWLYSKEYETEIDDTMIDILKLLGYKETLKLEMTKYYCFNGIEIQRVKELGLFLEVEGKTRKECWDKIKETGIKVSKECEIGKPQMMYDRENI